MNILIIVSLLGVAAGAVTTQENIKLSEEQTQRIIEYVATCGEQNSVDKTTVQALRAGQFSNVDQKAKCFTNCFLEKAGLLSNGQVQKDAISTKLGAIFGTDRVKVAMEQCNNLKGTDNCETAFELYKCYFNTNAAIA